MNALLTDTVSSGRSRPRTSLGVQTDTAGRSQSRSEKPLGSLQNARQLIEQAQQQVNAARRELDPARESREDLTLRTALSQLSGAHACVASCLHRTAVAEKKAKASASAPLACGGALDG